MMPLLPLTLATVLVTTSSVEGHWEGSVTCPAPLVTPGQASLSFALNVLIAPGPQGLQGFMSSPHEGLSAELKSIMVKEEQLRVTANVPHYHQAVLAGAIDGSSWTASLTQGPLSCSVTFQRSSDLELKALPIPPSAQTQPKWSWITVGEMIFRHYGVLGPKDTPGPASQCTIVRALFTGSEQFQCSTQCVLCESMGGGSVRDVAGMLTGVPRRLAASGRKTPRIFVASAPALEAREVMREIDQGNPVVVGLSPGAPDAISERLDRFLPPMHVALVAGYLKTSSAMWYLVDDPYPFPDPLTNPYVRQEGAPVFGLRQGVSIPVAYWIRESALKSGMQWSESFLLRSEPAPPPRGSPGIRAGDALDGGSDLRRDAPEL